MLHFQEKNTTLMFSVLSITRTGGSNEENAKPHAHNLFPQCIRASPIYEVENKFLPILWNITFLLFG